MSNAYDSDFYGWTQRQAALLRDRDNRNNEIDWDNIAEELDDLGHSLKSDIERRLENLVLHLLKWKYQPALQCGSWRGSIVEARTRVERLKEKNPSLKNYPRDCLAEIYPSARAQAVAETGREDFPDACPWTIENILADEWLP